MPEGPDIETPKTPSDAWRPSLVLGPLSARPFFVELIESLIDR